MMRTLRSGLTIGMLVAALAMTGGCGDNDNSENGNDNNGGPNPIRTATPAPPVRTVTPTPGNVNPTPTVTPAVGETVQVGFNMTASVGIQGFQFIATYPTASGSFEGTGENVNCTINPAGGVFTKNDNDQTGVLTLSVANSSNLTFPINISCPFVQTSGITAQDIVVTVQEVTQNNAAGNVADLSVDVSVN